MSSSALSANGALKDASEIQWFHDVDDDVPLPSTQPSQPESPHSKRILSHGTLDSFVSHKGTHVVPATVTATSRRSGRALKPSAKVREANHTATPASAPIKPSIPASTLTEPSIPAKRSSVAVPAPVRKHSRSTVADEDSDGSGFNCGDGTADLEAAMDEEDDDDAEEAYQKTKAYGDADRAVSFSGSLVLRSLLTHRAWHHLDSQKHEER